MKAFNHTSTENYTQKKQQIKLYTSNRVVCVGVEEIIRLEGDSNYTVVHTKTNKYISARTLKHYEGILDGSFFIRIHRSHLINMLHVKGLDIQASNSAVALNGGKNIEIARRKVKTVIKQLSFYIK
jgi:two-component system LytT family response regulator